jgi:hypothetical protein
MRIFCCIVNFIDRNGQITQLHHHETMIEKALLWLDNVILHSIKSGDVVESKTCTVGINC